MNLGKLRITISMAPNVDGGDDSSWSVAWEKEDWGQNDVVKTRAEVLKRVCELLFFGV